MKGGSLLARSRAKHKSRREGGSFLSLPHSVMRHPDFANASPRAVKLLIDIAVEYDGKNNGDLNAVMSRLKKRGWNSTSQLGKAKKELLERRLIIETRQGGLGIGPTLYALTWLDLNECGGKLDISLAAYTRRSFSLPSPHKVLSLSHEGAKAA